MMRDVDSGGGDKQASRSEWKVGVDSDGWKVRGWGLGSFHLSEFLKGQSWVVRQRGWEGK